ncbi:hypothetical protein Cpin_0052 [Chitinophaga pinensis DSM 2588]|uniref:Uncharacterized protein n=1 Tax=Chitinophaga pinensis (strain ATCC 43595 / DSM 2588 / LMG 13176 / NBRC 15968 / NCIMB 11800 / UQM 2034) TaxID=485918 RepID=A0A979GMR3_CHIPD|nr:hypothetical protein Cpin_0052 [Chitinophaga pinensis DSM 2588]
MTSPKENRHVIKRVRSHSKETLHNDKRFQRVRDNWKDFTRAARYAKLMRTVMESMQQPVHDRSRHTTLTKTFSQIIKSDTDAPPGQRNIRPGLLHLLTGIELNTGIALDDLFIFNYAMTECNMRDATHYLDHTMLYPKIIRKVLPPGVVDFEINIGVAEIDFEQLTFRCYQQSSALIPVKGNKFSGVKMEALIGQEVPDHLFVFLAISCYDKDKQFKTGAIRLLNVFGAPGYGEYLSATKADQMLLPESCSATDTEAPPEMPAH